MSASSPSSFPLPRRALLQLAGLGLPALLPAQPKAPLTAGQLVARIQANVGIPWRAQTVDRLIVGSPDQPVTGIVTTMMSTFGLLQQARAAGHNLVITHEPTFYSGQDTTDTLSADPTFQKKSAWLAAQGMVVFRFHDHWHAMQPDGIATGMAQELGWQRFAAPGQLRHFELPPTTVGALAAQLEKKLGAHALRVVGNLQMPVKRVWANWGYASGNAVATLARPDVDVLLAGEAREWELVEYVQDQLAAGLPKALILIGHIPSEQAGMKYCATWLRRFVPEVPVTFLPSPEPFEKRWA